MGRGLTIAGLLLVLFVAYMLWPLAGFYRLAAAIETKDASALARLVDFPALGKSLTKQFVHAYLEITGKKRERKKKPKLTLIERSVAIGMGTSIAEPIVAELLNEKALIRLMTEGRLALPGAKGEGAAAAEAPSSAPSFDRKTARDVWEIWLNSEYRGADVFVRLPPGKPREQQFRAKLSLSGLEWKLTSLELPEHVLMKSVKEIIAEQKKRDDDLQPAR